MLKCIILCTRVYLYYINKAIIVISEHNNIHNYKDSVIHFNILK